MRKKVVSIALVLSMAAAAMSTTGCSGKKETEAPQTEKKTEAPAQTEAQATEAAAEEETEAATEAAESVAEVAEVATEAAEAATEAVESVAEVAEVETEAPAEETEAATEAVEEAAAVETEAPAEETEAATEAPAEETEAVTEAAETEAPAEETEAPEAVTEAAEAATEAADAQEEAPAADVVKSDEIIKVGIFEPLTGENGGGGQQEVQGAEYGNAIRPTVVIDGVEYTVELDIVDNKSDKTEAITAADKLVADGVVAVIGSYGSGVSIAAGPKFAEAKIPAIGASCTNPQVTAGCEWYFRTCFLDPFQGSVMAQYAIESGYKNVAVISQLGDDYSTGLANYFIKGFTAQGGEIAGGMQQYETNQTDFKAILTIIKAANPDAIFAPTSITTAPLLIKQARELGLDCPLMAGDTWYNDTIITNAGAENCEGIVASTFFDEGDTSSQIVVDFVQGYKEWLNADEDRIKKNGGNDAVVGNCALTFDAYNVVCDALEAAGSTDGEAVKAALEGISSPGVTGVITFDEIGDAQKDTAYIDIIENGAFKFLKTVTVTE
ncbi:MAG: ABC transporter substrate-binding protein [Lachnospiraceae bacterium]|nr:ABC transporter substrate-binding protein [Lachnospiraceae bacterium]